MTPDARTGAELTALADRAERLVRDDPGAAAAEAEQVIARAAALGVTDASVARAHYVLAQVAAGAGELPAALALIERAQVEFESVGRVADALRTNLGRINVLNEMGRHGEAIAAGESVIATIPHLLGTDPAAAPITAAAHQNLGLCYELTGRATDALAAYAAAEARYREIGDIEGVGEVAYDRGLVLLSLGRIAEALGAIDTAIDVFRDAGLRAHLAAALTSAGEGHLQLGEFSRALARLQAAGRELAAIDAPWRDHTNLLALARTYLALNCFPEALDAYDAAERWLADSGMAADRARATWGMALARRGLGDLDGARRALEEAASAFAFSGHTQSLAAVLCERSMIEAERGERNLARRLADDALRAGLDAGAGAEVVRAHLQRATLMEEPDLVAAELHAAAAIVDELGLAPLEIAVWQALGRADLERGRVTAARRWFERAIERIETVRATIAHEALLGNFLHDKAAAYDGLVRCELEDAGPGHGARVLRASERARSRTLRELVEGQIERPATMASAADAHLAGELAAVHLELMEPTSSDRRRELRDRAALLERRIARQRLDRLDADHHRHDQAADREPIGVAGTVVAYHCFEDAIAVVVDDGTGPESVLRLDATPSSVSRELDRLAIQWDRCRFGREFVAQHERHLRGAVDRSLRALHEMLIAPIAELLVGSERLVVLPHDVLHAVPWAALGDGDDALVDHHEIVIGPSLSIVRHCEERVPPADGGVVVVGVADERVPEVRAEVHEVAARHAHAQVLADDDADAETLLGALRGARVAHLAGHGWWRSDNPMYSAIRAADRWVTAAELMAVDLTGALVVLSACDTGRVRALPGDELHGLARAILGSGARSLVACSWPADDASTRRGMAAFHEAVAAGAGPAAAVRAAQQHVRREDPHPYYWAGIQAIGAP